MSSLYSLIPLEDTLVFHAVDTLDVEPFVSVFTTPDTFALDGHTRDQAPVEELSFTDATETEPDISGGAEYREEPDPTVGWQDALLFP